MINTTSNISSKPHHVDFLTKIRENLEKQRKTINRQLAHPAKREQGVSYCRREQMRRNKAKHGKRQICIDLMTDSTMVIRRDYHMPTTERKAAETKPMSYLESYRASLLTSGYVLLDANPGMLVFQYEGQLH